MSVDHFVALEAPMSRLGGEFWGSKTRRINDFSVPSPTFWFNNHVFLRLDTKTKVCLAVKAKQAPSS